MSKWFFLFALSLAAWANAASVVAVMEIIPSGDDVNISISESRHLTDELRTRAREILPSEYTILTRDNIFQLLPPDEKEAACLAESCAVDIGRAIGAEYVTQGSIGRFEGMFTLTVELYESMSGNMLGSFVTESDNARGLLGTIREKAPALFAKIMDKNKANNALQPTIQTNEPATIHANIPAEPKKSHTSTWVAVGLDVLGAAAIGIGIYQNSQMNNYYNDAVSLKKEGKEWKGTYKKAQDASSSRNIFYAAGGALLLGGVAVHIWF